MTGFYMQYNTELQWVEYSTVDSILSLEYT